jgi:hypothetical protein
MGALDRAHRLATGIAERSPVPDGEELRLERPQRAGRLEVPSELTRAPGRPNLRLSPAKGGLRQMMLAFAASSVLVT